MLCDRWRNISITFETGPRLEEEEADDSVMDRVRLLSTMPLPLLLLPWIGTSYGRDVGPGLPGDIIRPATIGDPINEFFEKKKKIKFKKSLSFNSVQSNSDGWLIWFPLYSIPTCDSISDIFHWNEKCVKSLSLLGGSQDNVQIKRKPHTICNLTTKYTALTKLVHRVIESFRHQSNVGNSWNKWTHFCR